MTTIYHGWTKPVSDETRVRNEFNTCLHFLRFATTEKQGEYWITRFFAAWKDLEQYAGLSERRFFERCLLDIMAVDHAHRRYADPMHGYETPMQTRASLGD